MDAGYPLGDRKREALQELLILAKAMIKAYSAQAYPAPSDHDTTDW